MKLLGWLIPWWAWAIAGALVLGATFASGFKVASWRCDAAKTEALEKQQRAYEKRIATINEKAAEYERTREAARVEYRDREAKVREIYRDVPVPADCAAPGGVRDILAEAVASANSGQSGG